MNSFIVRLTRDRVLKDCTAQLKFHQSFRAKTSYQISREVFKAMGAKKWKLVKFNTKTTCSFFARYEKWHVFANKMITNVNNALVKKPYN